MPSPVACPRCGTPLPKTPGKKTPAVCPKCSRKAAAKSPERRGMPLWAVALAVGLAGCAVGGFALIRSSARPDRAAATGADEPKDARAEAAAPIRYPAPVRPPVKAETAPENAEPQPETTPQRQPEPTPPQPKPKEPAPVADAAPAPTEVPETEPPGPLGVKLVYLEPPDYLQDPPAEGQVQRILLRELFRQAFLIAARDQLGLTTRDGALRERPPVGLADGNRLRLQPGLTVGKPAQIKVQRGGGPSRRLVWQHSGPAVAAGPIDTLALAKAAEALSRTAFVEGLRKASFDGQPNKAGSTTPVPSEVEDLLADMHFLAQCIALRELHELIRLKGESPQLVGGLVRGYANLGMLTENNWDAGPKAFKARALLYAQRLVSADANGPWGLWHRAYASALTGLHQPALDDLAAADRLSGGSVPKPAWVALLERFCRFDTAGLKPAPADKRLAPLAAVLRFLTVERPGAGRMTLETAEDALKVAPDCSRVREGLVEVGPVAARQKASSENIKSFENVLARRLKALPEFQERLQELLRLDGGTSEMLTALAEAGVPVTETGEPSLTVPARVAQETVFAQTCRRIVFLREELGRQADEAVSDVGAVMEGHPYAALLRALEYDPGREAKEYAQAMKKVRLRDLSIAQGALGDALARVGPEQEKRARGLVNALSDDIYGDWVRLGMRSNPAEQETKVAESLYRLSPHSPVARSVILTRPGHGTVDLAAWEKEAQQPIILVGLGRLYTREKRWADAERCLRRALEMSPDVPRRRALAELFRAQGKNEQWVATLEEALAEPDSGLEHTLARVDIARHFMNRGAYKRAQAYAEEAAATKEGSALRCAAECNEALANWDEAELYTRWLSERYLNCFGEWFLWCKRTGRGESDLAGFIVEIHLIIRFDWLTPEERAIAGAYHLLTEQAGKASEQFEAIYSQTHEPRFALMAALAYDQLALPARRDHVYRTFPEGNPLTPLARLFRECLERNQNRLDASAVEEILRAIPADEARMVRYIVGHFLLQRGQKKEAAAYFERVVRDYGRQNHFIAALAATDLRSLQPKETPEKKDGSEKKKDGSEKKKDGSEKKKDGPEKKKENSAKE